MENKDRKWIAYCRVSTEIQASTGFSLEAQKLAIENFIKKNDLTLLTIYSEQVSGTTKPSERREFKKVMKDLSGFVATGLIVPKMDRLSRDVDHLRAILKKYFMGADKKHKIIFLDNPGLDLSRPIDRLSITMMGGFNEFEVDIIKERSAIVMNHKKSKGQKLGGYVPWGFKCVEKQEGGRMVKYLEPDEEERKLHKKLKDMREKENYTYRELAEWMNNEKIKNREGKVHWKGKQMVKLIYPEAFTKKKYKRKQKD